MIDQQDRDTYPLTYPALLLDAPDTVWSNIKGLSQKGTATIRARLIIDCYDDTHYGSHTVNKIACRAEMRRKVHKLLQGYRLEGDGTLIRTSSRFYTWNHGIKVYEQVYTGVVTEMIEMPTRSVDAEPLIHANHLGSFVIPAGGLEPPPPRISDQLRQALKGKTETGRCI